MTAFLILFLLKSFSDTTFDFLEAFHIHKNHNNVVNCNIVFPYLSDFWKTYIKSNFSWFFFHFHSLQLSFLFFLLLVNFFNFLQFYWLQLFTLGSFAKLHERIEIVLSLIFQNSMMLSKLQYVIFFCSISTSMSCFITPIHLFMYYVWNTWRRSILLWCLIIFSPIIPK